MLVGNLGVDILVQLLGPILGLEAAVKLIVAAIPPLTTIGILWISKEIHGRVAPTAFFAIPFIYSFPFNYGFLNYSLALALALISFGLWLKMTRLGRLRARNILFVPISCALWVTHAFGWGILGLLALAAELIRIHDADPRWKVAFIRACLNVAPMSLPIVAMIWGAGNVVGGDSDFTFGPLQKAYALVATLRDRWLLWDSFGVAVGVLVIGAAYFDHRLNWSRRLAIPAVLLGAVFLIMPGKLLGLSYADFRLAPVVFIVALVAIRSEPENDRTLAILGLAFLFLRLAGTTVSYAIADRDMKGWLTALDQIPRGSAVLFLSGEYCGKRWPLPRHTHVGSFVITRKYGFSNDQWEATGAQLLRVHYWEARRFRQDRSTFINSEECIARTEALSNQSMLFDHRLESVMWRFPREAFDYVWLIDVPGADYRNPRGGMTSVWRGDQSVLYRVERKPTQHAVLPGSETTGASTMRTAAEK